MSVTSRLRVDDPAGVPSIVAGDLFDLTFSVNLAAVSEHEEFDTFVSSSVVAPGTVTLARVAGNIGTWNPAGLPTYSVITTATAGPGQQVYFTFNGGTEDQPVPGYNYGGIGLGHSSPVNIGLIQPALSAGAPLATFLGNEPDFNAFDNRFGGIFFGFNYTTVFVQFTALTTNVTFTAVPEPSTYAALAGVAALGLAAWRRRVIPRLA